MRWSRITLRPSGAAHTKRAPKSLPFAIELPLMSDGRIALHELVAETDRAVVEQALPEGGLVTGGLVVRDNQCIFSWPEDRAGNQPEVRILGGLFFVGAFVALRPGSGPAQLYEVVTCTSVAREDRVEQSVPQSKHPA